MKKTVCILSVLLLTATTVFMTSCNSKKEKKQSENTASESEVTQSENVEVVDKKSFLEEFLRNEFVEIPDIDIYMLKTEVTQNLYESIIGENPSVEKDGNNPVEMVSWCDAIYFCNKLSEEYGLEPVYAVDGETDVVEWNYEPHNLDYIYGEITQNDSANGFRLPTPDEWEYAAESGQNYYYAGSDILDEVGWYKDNSEESTHPVAQKKSNDYGLYDMSGNVWEWVWSSEHTDYRYIYGGSYSTNIMYCGVNGWYKAIFYQPRYNVGFRVVCNSKNKSGQFVKPVVNKDFLGDLKDEFVEIPGHNIFMLQTEVTQKLYESVMGENPSDFKGENNPVESVSWYDAIYFCNKLSEEYGLEPVYAVDGETDVFEWDYEPHNWDDIYGEITQNESANGFRLPTSNEWEYAAKAEQDYDGYIYFGSDNLKYIGWFKENSNGKTHPVAQKEVNVFGLYDMSGNVSEWVFGSLYYGSTYHYHYGSGFNYNKEYWKVNDGISYRSSYQSDDIGFRIVCSASN